MSDSSQTLSWSCGTYCAGVGEVLLRDDSTTDDLFHYTPACSKPFLFFCKQFHSLGLQSVENNSKHDFAGTAESADGTMVLTLLEVVFLQLRYDGRLCPLLRPFLRLPDPLAYRCQDCCCCLVSSRALVLIWHSTLADGSETSSQPHPGNRFCWRAKLSEGLVRC